MKIYGRVPGESAEGERGGRASATAGTNGDVPIVTKQLVGHVDNSSYPEVTVDIQATLVTPTNVKGKVPVMILFGGGAPIGGRGRGPVAPAAGGGMGQRGAAPPPAARAGRGPQGPTAQQQLLAKGWGYASLSTGSVQADNGAGLKAGIIGLVNKGQPRKPDDWGVLRAWAWGASKVLDYLETDKAVNAKEVGLEGHSRWGKATIVAMAYDQRFAIAYAFGLRRGRSQGCIAAIGASWWRTSRPTANIIGWRATS